MAYACVRTDNMSGTVNGKDLVSLKYMPDGTAKEIENGNVVLIGDFIDGERDLRVAKNTSTDSELADCALIATPEVVKEKSNNSLDEFTNKADTVIRGYRLTSKDIFSVTKEAFTESSTLAVGSTVELTTGTKFSAVASASGATVVGKIVLIEGDWYVVEVA